MKVINSITELDEKVLCRREDEHGVFYYAPMQEWTKKAMDELSKEGIFLDVMAGIAIMKYFKFFVVGHADDGCLSFMKDTEYFGYDRTRYLDFHETYATQEILGLQKLFNKALKNN